MYGFMARIRARADTPATMAPHTTTQPPRLHMAPHTHALQSRRHSLARNTRAHVLTSK